MKLNELGINQSTINQSTRSCSRC